MGSGTQIRRRPTRRLAGPTVKLPTCHFLGLRRRRSPYVAGCGAISAHCSSSRGLRELLPFASRVAGITGARKSAQVRLRVLGLRTISNRWPPTPLLTTRLPRGDPQFAPACEDWLIPGGRPRYQASDRCMNAASSLGSFRFLAGFSPQGADNYNSDFTSIPTALHFKVSFESTTSLHRGHQEPGRKHLLTSRDRLPPQLEQALSQTNF